MDSLEDKNMNPNKVRAPKDLKEANKVMFEEFDVPKETIDTKAEELNKKYNLADKGISFTSKPTSGGKNVMALVFSGAPFREKYKTVTRPFSEDNIKELEKILEPITKTKLFKNYSASGERKKAASKAGQTKLKYNQPELFDYLLNKEGPISKKEVIKELGYDDGTIRKAIGNLHANMYRALDPNKPGSGKFLSENYNSNQIKIF